MPQIYKLIILLFVCFDFCLLSVFPCYYIAENYYFDKFFYKKDILRGYYVTNKTTLYDFDQRSKDIIALNENKPNILGVSDNNSFKVAIIGDSFVWGLGLRNEQRFAVILENKLNRIKPTKIISIGEPGNSTLDFLRRYDQLRQSSNTDLNIFVVVDNDAFVNRDENNYHQTITNCQKSHPSVQPVYDIFNEIYLKHGENANYGDPNIIKDIAAGYSASWQNPINLCIVESSLKQLPTDNTIYFIPDNYMHDNGSYDKYTSLIKSTNKYVLSTEIGEKMKKYHQYWDLTTHKNFLISPNEGHPNALANRMYADILFNEITTNPKWNFIKK